MALVKLDGPREIAKDHHKWGHVKSHYRRTGWDGDTNTMFKVKAHQRRVAGLPFETYPFIESYCDNNSQLSIIGAAADGDTLSTQRASFRTLVQNNVHGLANTLDKMVQKDKNAVLNMWQNQFGGDANSLLWDIVIGKQKPVVHAADIKDVALPYIEFHQPVAGIGIPFGTRDFSVSGNYIILNGTGNGSLPGAQIPFPPKYQDGTPVTDPDLQAEYVVVVSASLGDGLGYSSDEISVRQQDMTNNGIVIPNPASIAHTSGSKGGSGVPFCLGGNILTSAASILNAFIPGTGMAVANVFGSVGNCNGATDKSGSRPPAPPFTAPAFPVAPVLIGGGLALGIALWLIFD